MIVAQTSFDCYLSLDIKQQCKDVLSTLNVLGESCISDIAAFMNMERSTIAARLNELKHINLIVFTENRKSNRTRIMSEHYRIRRSDDPIERIENPVPVRKEISEAARILASARGMKQKLRLNQQLTLFGN